MTPTKKHKVISFKATKEEHVKLSKIAQRAVAMAQDMDFSYPFQDALMDVNACHSNGCPLKLEELLASDDFNFAHDVFGIRRHINRRTGELQDCFLPRYAMAEQEAVSYANA